MRWMFRDATLCKRGYQYNHWLKAFFPALPKTLNGVQFDSSVGLAKYCGAQKLNEQARRVSFSIFLPYTSVQQWGGRPQC